jgi:hypothetical protein
MMQAKVIAKQETKFAQDLFNNTILLYFMERQERCVIQSMPGAAGTRNTIVAQKAAAV